MASVRSPIRFRGIALMELALILPLVLLLTFGVIEYGWAFTKSAELTNAARHGARVGIRPDATSGQVTADIAAFLGTAGLGDSGYSVTLSPPDVSALDPGETFTVNVSVPYAGISLTGFPLLPVPASLRASVAMAKEGPPPE